MWRSTSASALAAAVATFAIALGASVVLANYVGQLAGLLIGPILGTVGAVAILGKQYWVAALPAAVLPAAFLSAEHTGLLVLLVLLATAIAAVAMYRRQRALEIAAPM